MKRVLVIAIAVVPIALSAGVAQAQQGVTFRPYSAPYGEPCPGNGGSVALHRDTGWCDLQVTSPAGTAVEVTGAPSQQRLQEYLGTNIQGNSTAKKVWVEIYFDTAGEGGTVTVTVIDGSRESTHTFAVRSAGNNKPPHHRPHRDPHRAGRRVADLHRLPRRLRQHRRHLREDRRAAGQARRTRLLRNRRRHARRLPGAPNLEHARVASCRAGRVAGLLGVQQRVAPMGHPVRR